jgi:hypothetical protein
MRRPWRYFFGLAASGDDVHDTPRMRPFFTLQALGFPVVPDVYINAATAPRLFGGVGGRLADVVGSGKGKSMMALLPSDTEVG